MVVPIAAVAEIVIEAVTLVLVGVPVIVPLTPALPDTTAVAPARPVPVKVTGNVVPTVPAAGATEVSVVLGLTVNVTVYGVPPTMRPRVVVPGAAVAKIVIEALTDVADAAVIVPLTPLVPDTTAVAPDRLVPAKVTENVVPTVPVGVFTDVSVTTELTVKGKE